MTQPKHAKVLILGSGPAGYTAAIYAARAMLNPLLIQGSQPGGQLTITTDVENYPGFADVIQGPWLMEQMQAQAEHVGTEIVLDQIEKVDLQKRPFRLEGHSGDVYTCDALIICTGAQARWLGIPSEEAFKGHGVSACATCDGFFYKGKEVVVIGGGNTAVEEAIFLTNFAQPRHHRASARPLPRREDPAGSPVQEPQDRGRLGPHGRRDPRQQGPKSVTGVRLKNVKTGKTEERAADGVFIAIGHAPATELFKGQLEMTQSGYLMTKPDSTATSIPGVYAAGDVKDEVYRQAVTAAAMGCMAALEAERYFATLEIKAEAAAE